MTENYVLDGVLSSDVLSIWDDVWPIAKRAVDRFTIPNKFTEDEIRAHLCNKTMQLWVVEHDEKIAAIAITSIITNEDHFPDEKLLEVPFVAGHGMKHWLPDLYRTLKLYALSHGCNIMVGYGRLGWKRLIGFEIVGEIDPGVIVMARRLNKDH